MIVFHVKLQAQTRRTESNCHLTQFKIRSFLQVTQEAIFALDGPMSALLILHRAMLLRSMFGRRATGDETILGRLRVPGHGPGGHRLAQMHYVCCTTLRPMTHFKHTFFSINKIFF